MIKVENIDVFGWKGAIRGMRNPMNSWDKSDSSFIAGGEFYDILGSGGPASPNEKDGDVVLGFNDIELMKRLIKGGPEHRKFLRMIHIQMDVTAPLYWWKQFDTYKVATVDNSCSTMHKIHDKEFVLDDFSHEHLTPVSVGFMAMIIERLNVCRDFFCNMKDKESWWQMIQLLPDSYNQRRTLDFNYETAMTILHQREGHKLDEWHTFCGRLMNLPYMEVLYDG